MIRYTNVRVLIPNEAPLDAAWPSSQPLPVEGTYIQVRRSAEFVGPPGPSAGFHVRRVVNVIEQDRTGMWEFWLEVHA